MTKPERIKPTHSTSKFTRFAKAISHWGGHPWAFIGAVLLIAAWAITGPIFQFSTTWQLVINTGTSITTFLMVFLIQNTQNRDSIAIQVKLDELIRVVDGAHNALMDLEELDERELNLIRSNYEKLAGEARKHLRAGMRDTDVPEVVLENPKPEIKPPTKRSKLS